MPSYTIRVDLPCEGDEAFAALDRAMKRNGFVDWIRSSDKCQLPRGEYNLHHSDLDLAGVLEQAVTASKAVRTATAPLILVTEAAGRLWSGLGPWCDTLDRT